ncbi:helix-loop-helix protein 11 [Daphnia magna]|uniref:BHLH domain-containing protein n=1 Tax=Daphnia magna TaxID=35525 RepID=A0ABQ9ZUZ1_9CRUS|nr:helix-loop-helix protein 11 [Daphnia magna]KAK4016692.1 hypothetical protein OUZ56_031655 [Daphnia magna]
MSIMFNKAGDKRRHDDVLRHDEEGIEGLCSLGDSSPQESMEGGWVDEKRVRREIANSNERRRMQSINSGFQSLRTLLPQSEGEKLSKAAILQQTTEYIYQLEQEKTRLVAQNCHLKRLLGPLKSKDLSESTEIPLSPEHMSEVTVGGEDVLLSGVSTKKKIQDPPPLEKEKRKGVLSGEAYSRAVDRLRKEVNESKALLEAERKLRLKLEEQIHALEAQLQLQIDVPEVDNSEEITAHILGRKPNPPPKLFKSEAQDDESDLINAARDASSTSNQRWNNNRRPNQNSRRNLVTTAAMSPRLNRRESTASPNSSNDHNQVQFMNSQSNMMTSLPAHLVLDDRPNSRTGSLLAAAMMAEPKVEVELASRVPSPALSLSMTGGPASPASSLPLSSLPVLSFQLPPHLAHLSHLAHGDGSSSPIVLQHAGEEVTFVDIDAPFSSDSKSYLAATSRQNLETIVEAIRHLEGDHLFNDDLSGSRKGQLVEVEIDTEGEPIGCSLVVTSSQDELRSEDGIDEQLAITEEQEVGEMITVSTEAEVDSNSDNVLDDGELVHGPNVIIVKRI